MEKPESRISHPIHNARVNDNGLDTETASLPVVSNALKLLFGFCDFDEIAILQETPMGTRTRFTLALPENSRPDAALVARIAAALKPFTQQMRHGTVPAWRADTNPMESYSYQLDSLEFDVDTAQKPALLKTMAAFVNEEAAVGNEPFTWVTGDRKFLLRKIAQIQQTDNNGRGLA